MKKNFKSVFAFAAMAAMLGVTSCNDDLNLDADNQVVSQSGRLCGYTNLIVSADSIADERVDLSRGDLVISNINNELSYTIEQDGEGYHLVTHVNGNMNLRHFDKVTITSPDGRSEEMRVTIDPVETVTRNASYDTSMNPYQDKACSIIGCGVDYLGTLGAPKSSNIIDVNRFLTDDNRPDFSEALMINKNVNGNNSFFEKGSSLTEISEQVEEKMGMKVKFPVKCLNISAGFDQSHFSKTDHSELREYMMAGVNVVGFEAKLNPTQLCNVAADVAKKSGDTSFEDDDETYACLLNKNFNNILNNPGASKRVSNKYPSTEEGMIQLIKDFGTHVVTEAQFGGYAQASYDMKTVTTSNKVEDYLGYELGLSSNTTTTGESTKTTDKKDSLSTMKSIFKTAVAPVTPSLDFSRSTKNTSESLSKQIDSHQYCKTAGGIVLTNADDIQQWTCGGVETMVPLSYATVATQKDILNGLADKDENLVPLYEFCTDPVRCAILKKLLTPDSDGILPYYKKVLAGKETEAGEKGEMVIADVKLVYFDTNKLDASIYAPRVMTDYFGNSRTYYPMVANADDTAHKSDIGKVFTLNERDYTGVDHIGRIICYYALDYSNNCKGITNIRLMTDGEYKDYGQTNEYKAEYVKHGKADGNPEIDEGVCTDHGNNGYSTEGNELRTCKEGARRLYVTYGTKDTPLKDKIKGVAWHVGDCSKIEKGSLLCSSGGTEYSIDNEFTANEYKAFNNYWLDNNYTKCTSTYDNGYFTRYQYRTTYFINSYDWTSFYPSKKIEPVFSTKSMFHDMTQTTRTVNGQLVRDLPIAHPL